MIKGPKKPIIIVDFDGCLTVAQKFWHTHPDHSDVLQVTKAISDIDSNVISHVNSNIRIIVVSKDKRINELWCKLHEVEFVYCPPGLSKREVIKEYWKNSVSNKYTPWRNYYYLGNTLEDFPCMKNAKLAFCPSDASERLKIMCEKSMNVYELKAKGGCGALEEMLLMLATFGEIDRGLLIDEDE